jgi:hypothetical protein
MKSRLDVFFDSMTSRVQRIVFWTLVLCGTVSFRGRAAPPAETGRGEGEGTPVSALSPETRMQASAAARDAETVLEFIRAVERPFLDLLKEEYEPEFRMRGEFVVCREASTLLAVLLSALFDLPVGGTASSRVEVANGARIARETRRVQTLHSWVALFLGGKKILIDPVHAQFDASYRTRFLIGPYARTLERAHLLDWKDLMEEEKARSPNYRYLKERFPNASDEQIAGILRMDYHARLETLPGMPPPAILQMFDLSKKLEAYRHGRILVFFSSESLKRMERVLAGIDEEVLPNVLSRPLREAVVRPGRKAALSFAA